MNSTPKDPTQTIERLYIKLHGLQEMGKIYEAKGWTHLTQLNKRQVAGIKSAITRYSKMI